MCAMVKRKLNRIIALTMACFIFTVALFLESELYKADTVPGSMSYSTGLLSISDMPTWESSPLPNSIEHVTRETLAGVYNYIYFKKAYLSGFAFNASSSAYAYKVEVSPISHGFTSKTNVEDARLVMGTYDDILSGEGVVGFQLDNPSVSTFWITTNYSEMSIKLGAYVSMYTLDIPADGGYSTQGAIVGFDGNYGIEYTPYTLEEYTDSLLADIKAELEAHGDLTEELKALLEEALISDGGSPLVDILGNISSNLNDIKYSYLWQMKNDLKTLVTDTKAILEEEQKQTSWLEKIWNSIQDFLNPTEEDQNKVDGFNSESVEQSSQMDDLVEGMDSLDKPDADSFNSDLSGIVSGDAIGSYSAVLATITESKLVFSMLIILFTIAIVGYALFGKRG